MKKGYNTAFTFSNLAANKIPTSELVKIMNDNGEKPDLLRFSGGSLSFKYDISAKDYGDAKSNKHLNIINPKNYIHNFIELIKGLKHTPKIIYCLNLHPFLVDKKYDTIENCLLPLVFFKESLGENSVETIELGNELYLYFIKNIQLYIELCEILIPKIRSIFPNALISVPTEGCISARGQEWNKKVMSIKGIDGISPHHYLNDLKSADDVNEYIKKISFLINKKMEITNLKIICTEYGFEYTGLSLLDYSKEKEAIIISKMEANFEKLNYDTIIFHTLLMNKKSMWGKYIIEQNEICLRK